MKIRIINTNFTIAYYDATHWLCRSISIYRCIPRGSKFFPSQVMLFRATGLLIDRSIASVQVQYMFDKESSVTLLLLLLYTQTNKQCVHIHHNMAPRTAVSRKRDRRKMMREAELRRQVQERQQQHPNNIGDTGIMMASPPGSQGQAGLAGLLHTGHQSTSETLAERDGEDGTEQWRRQQKQQQQQQQQHNWNESQHPPDCPCILRKLARDDLFLPPSLRIQEDISDTNNDKA